MKTISLFFVLMVCLFTFNLGAEELVNGKRYQGPVTLEVGQAGVSFNLPKGWIGGLDGGVFVAIQNGKNAVVVISVEQLSFKQALAKLASPIDVGEGMVLKVQGKPKVKGRKIRVPATISGNAGSLNGEVYIEVGKAGYTVSMVGFGKTVAEVKASKKALASISRSLKLRKPKKPKSSGFWAQYLVNKSVTLWNNRTSSSLGNGSSSSKTYTFCPNNRFTYYSSFSFQNTTEGVADVDGSGNSDDSGTWTVKGNQTRGTITLNFSDGSSGSATLSFGPKGELLVDGQRWLRKDIVCN